MQNRKAFTMVELVFVIVVIGILTAVAIPKLAATRDDAEITVGINTLASVRNAIATERQKRILRGDFTNIGTLFSGDTYMFNAFDGNTSFPVLEYPVKQGNNNGEWSNSNNEYTFHFLNGKICTFVLANNTFQLKSGTTCTEMGL